jgi:hypothetical protein
MKISKTIAISIVLLLMISIGTSMTISLPSAAAHTPPWSIATHAYISVSPNPVGVGQDVTVVVWLDKVIEGATGTDSIRFHNYQVTITKPDGTTSTIKWDTITDPTSSIYTTFTPDQVGTYTLNFTFPGQLYTSTEPIAGMGGPPSPNQYTNDTYTASTASTTLTVQAEPIAATPGTPLPTEYWTRPIYGENTEWYTISSNWLIPGSTFSSWACIQPDGIAPNSAHIMWTKEFSAGGVVGGTANTEIAGETYYSGLSYEAQYCNAIIINGKLYYNLGLSNDAGSSGFGGATASGPYVCVDLRTGQELWRQNYAVNPTLGMIVDYNSVNQHGAIPSGFLIATAGGGSNPFGPGTPSTWIAYDAETGAWLFNITDVPAGTQVMGPNGEYLIYQYNAAGQWLAMWNSSQAILNGQTGSMYGTQTWRPVGQSINGNAGWQWNITTPSAINIDGSTIQKASCGDMILGSGTLSGGLSGTTQTTAATLWALNLNASKRTIGSLMWIKTYDIPAGNVSHMLGPADFNARVFTMSDKETMVWYGYSLDSGALLWGPTEQNHNAFDYYGNMGGNDVLGFTSYGNLYTSGYGGIIFCYDLKTGTQLWTYGNGGEGNSTNSGVETVYGHYPLFINGIADGKIYAYTDEHSPNSPQYKGALQRCINASTGQEIWTISSWDSSSVAIADGYLNYLNTYDMQIYTIGRGPSATTVEAPQTAITAGDNVVIQGTVMDTSAGTQQSEQKADFPNGVPVCSDASMTQWMGYVYQQQAEPTNFTGVTVTLTAIDPNSNFITLGTATTDASGHFIYSWQTPQVPGKYTVTATFAGTNGYWGSSEETGMVVQNAPATPAPTATPQSNLATMSDLTIGFAAAVIAIIIAIAIVGLLLLRKRP